MRPSSIILVVALSGLLINSGPTGRLNPGPDARIIPLSQTLRIAVETLGPSDSSGRQNLDSPALLISPGEADELPEGPDGFDVLDDGRLLITDPLRNRLAVFDSQANFRQAWKIGFAADQVIVLPNSLVSVRDARTGEAHVFDQTGRPRPDDHVALPKPAEAKLLTGNSGLIMRPGAGNATGTPLTIQYEQPGSRLISLEMLASESTGETYVALETTGNKASDEVSVNKYVRKYSSDGKLAAEIKDIPLDYYVPPVDEFKVHRGQVYQLFTGQAEVRVNIWNMN